MSGREKENKEVRGKRREEVGKNDWEMEKVGRRVREGGDGRKEVKREE